MRKHKLKTPEPSLLSEDNVELKVDDTSEPLVISGSASTGETESVGLPENGDSGANFAEEPTAVSTPTRLALGLPERYRVLSVLGEGGMATVYKAADSESGDSLVAIKILNQELARDPVVVERFYREARAAHRIVHQNIVQVFDCATTSANVPYLVMEFIDGADLAEIIKSEKHLSVGRSISIFVQLCDVLQKAHDTGLVHRDIKPSNILITRGLDGEEIVKLTDFGIAKPSSSERAINPALTHTGSILGSPAYMSPEQAMGESVDERSDIYSLGCVMYETLTGRSPFADETPVKSILKHIEQSPEPFEIEFKHLDIPKGLEDTVMKCLKKKQSKRFQKIYQVRQSLTTLPSPGIYRRMLSHYVDAVLILLGFTFVQTVASKTSSDNFLLSILFICLYYVLFESSKLQATPGKLLTGLKAYDRNGNRLNPFAVMACISAVTWIFTLIFGLSSACCYAFLTLAHPVKASLAWGLFLGIWLIIVNSLPTAYNHGRQDLFDIIFGRTVTKPYYSGEKPKKTPPVWIYIILSTIFVVMPFLANEIAKDFFQYMERNGSRAVVVAKEEIPEGTVIQADMLITRHVFPCLVAPRFLADPKVVIGRRASRDIETSDPIGEKSLAPDGRHAPNYQGDE